MINLRQIIFILSLSVALCSTLRAQSTDEKDPGPDDFLLMDKEAVLDRQSLAKSFVYPDSARKAGIQGTVSVKVLIGKSGKAERYLIIDAVHPLLDSAAAQAIMNATFTAAMYAGRNIKSWMEVPISFKMKSTKSQPVKIQSDPEGDGYQRSVFNVQQFYDSLDKNILHVLTQQSVNVAIVVSSDGHCTDVKTPGILSEAVLNEIRRVLQHTQFTPALRDGKVAEDHLTLIIDVQAK